MRGFWLSVFFESVIYFSNLLFLFCTAQVSEIRPEYAVINETETANFQCVLVENDIINFGWEISLVGKLPITLEDGHNVPGIGSVTINENRTNLTLANVCRSVNGATITCTGVRNAHDPIHVFSNITVQYPPEYTPLESVPDPLPLGASVQVAFNVCANPTPQNPNLTKGGDPVSSNRVAYSVNEVDITDLQCDDGGWYTLQSSNAAGVGSGKFMLNIANTSAVIRNDAVVPVVVQSTETDISLAGVVNGCPDLINITCSLAGNLLFTAVVDVSENTTVTDPPRLKRSQFVSNSVSQAGNITLCCTASNGVGNMSKDVTIRYDKFETPSLALGSGEIAGIVVGCIALVFTVWIVFNVIIICIGCYWNTRISNAEGK